MKKKNNDLIIDFILPNGDKCIISKNAYVYINKVHELEKENAKLRREIEAIKPVIESKKLKPAISNNCSKCIYCVKNDLTGDILGCNKDNVCDDFKPNINDYI